MMFKEKKNNFALTLFFVLLICFNQNCVWQASATDNQNGTLDMDYHFWGLHLTVAKCSQIDISGANMYNAVSKDCSNGTAGTFQYCSQNDGSCDDGIKLNGNGVSGAFSTCANLTLANLKWRVPDSNEVRDIYHVFLQDKAHFPNSVISVNSFYWSSDVYEPNPYAIGTAWDLSFYDGSVQTPNKTTYNYVRCVSP